MIQKGLVFAKYPIQDFSRNNSTAPTSCPPISSEYTESNEKQLEIVQHIYLENKRIGSIYIAKDLQTSQEYIAKHKISVFIVFVAIMLFAYLMAMRFQSSISSPVQRLTKAAKEIAERQDYGVRVKILPSEKDSNEQELNQLLSTFNKMLEQVEEHARQLQKNNLELGKAKETARRCKYCKNQISCKYFSRITHPT